MKLIDGKLIAEKVKDGVTREILRVCADCDKPAEGVLVSMPRPNLAIVLVGERADSEIYVGIKEREAVKVGIDTNLYRFPADCSHEEIIATIDFLNKDSLIDAILVQLPLPEHLDADTVIAAIDPEKDVDRFHPANTARFLASCEHQAVMPPLVQAVFAILDDADVVPNGKRAAVIFNSPLFGQTIGHALECRGLKSGLFSPDDPGLAAGCLASDIVVTAVGRPGLLTSEMLKDGAVVIDIGIARVGGKVVGDLDKAGLEERDISATPVPGGVGPITVAMLFRNTVELYKKRRNVS